MIKFNPHPIINLDGTRLQITARDLDGDGVTGGIERVSAMPQKELKFIQQKSELGEVTEQMNKDEIENETGMSSMDKMSRLHPVQIPAIAIWDYLVNSNFLPRESLHVSRQIKRLEVSREGLGRHEYVEVVGRKAETDAKKSGFGDKMKSWFGGGQQQK